MTESSKISHTPRIYIESPLSQGVASTPSADQSHYLQHVLRMRVGDSLRLFNGQDGEWLGRIATIGKRAIEISIKEQLRPQTGETDLALCCAPIKKAHFDYMIEKATELGVGLIQPLLTSRTQIREVNIERCRTIAIEAAEQSERLNIPVLKKPVTLVELMAQWPTDRIAIICAEWGDATPVHESFMSGALKSVRKATIITGPEGGFAADELEMLRTKKQTVFIRLGPRILRADTAAIAALTCWQAMRGDWI